MTDESVTGSAGSGQQDRIQGSAAWPVATLPRRKRRRPLPTERRRCRSRVPHAPHVAVWHNNNRTLCDGNPKGER